MVRSSSSISSSSYRSDSDSTAPSRRKELRFVVNGKLVLVRDADPRTSLGDFLRDHLLLRGLKLACRQGGCGSCTVVISAAVSDKMSPSFLQHRPVNSCLRPLCSVDGMVITTVEGIGSCKTGLHPVQESLVNSFGTQCGFCTPGIVMSMYGLLLETPTPEAQQVEDQLDGNICRCTGYRPILDAFQTFACSPEGCSRPNWSGDIEDVKLCNEPSLRQDDEIEISKDGVTWIRVQTLSSLFKVVNANSRGVQVICGNTSSGVYPQQLKGVVVDITHVKELSQVLVTSQGVRVGGAVPLSDLVQALKSEKELCSSYQPFLQHLKRVATQQVRNVGTVSGNLMMAHKHPDFVSDVATLLAAVDAKIKTYPKSELSVEDFFKLDNIEDIIILEILLPVLPPNARLFTYKVALRRVNAHAIVNAGFKFEIDSAIGKIQSCPVITYGGVRAYPVRAKKTEAYLVGKSYMDPKVCDAALETLLNELVTDNVYGQQAYRKSLLAAFLYKAMLSLWPKDRLPKQLQSATEEYSWPVTSGTVSFDKGDPSEYPVSKALPKLSAMSQTTGEAKYLEDVKFGDELHATYVLSTVGNATIKSIDFSKAISVKGVVTFISAKTITAAGYSNDVSEYEEVFATSKVSYYGQAVGLIVAKSKAIADQAAKLVDVQYADVQKPVITIEDAIAADSFFEDRNLDYHQGNVEEAFVDPEAVVVEGQVGVGHQYHFHLETQRAICVPSEDGFMEVHSSTQNPSQIQSVVGAALKRSQHKITVVVKKVGGAYGAKLNRSASIAMACALAADMLKRPVRLILDMSTNMQLVGARSPYLCKYKMSGKRTGRVTGVQMQIFNNHGAHFDFEYPSGDSLLTFIDGAYNISNWDLKMKIARTNLPACTYMRGPVFVETTYMIETALEHLGCVLNLGADRVREVNMYKPEDVTLAGQRLSYCNAELVFASVKDSSEYNNRCKQVSQFNAKNLWRKRGLSIVPVKFVAGWESQQHLALINIYPDGSISIHHSGCEIGQGLDVKVAQVASMTLGSLLNGEVPLENIAVHTTTTVVANNVSESGGSVTSELCAKAVHDGCTQLVERLRVVRKLLLSTKKGVNWKDLIDTAVSIGVDLQARGRVYPEASKDGPSQYISFGAAVTEVEVDMLTGETSIARADLLLDCGKSLNPGIDIGQVQGAFVQGLGYFLSEEFRHDRLTGKLLTDSTWEYKPPSSRDIPYILNAALLSKSENPSGFLRSKFSGEPPYGMACSAILAVAQAVAAAKEQWGGNGWSPLTAPATPENVAMAAELPVLSVSFRELFLESTEQIRLAGWYEKNRIY